ncbi:phage tail protein [uncultured Subdoligranulum sp.]|uniref:phage tail tube protein n=1 Tax=uncultured Subdoligranulum sp. TaxID=512298 RepID=UPI00262438CA|nr:phage tail protein [uncultured Subdoligranulum sp.]
MATASKNKASNVTAGKPKITGAIFRAPVGSTLPTDAKTELDTAFKCLGYVSEDGVTNGNSPESEQTKAWGGDVVLSTQTEKPDTFQFKLIEAKNVDVLKMIYGDSHVTGDLDTGIKVDVTAEDPGPAAYVIDMILKDGDLKRLVIPSASISEMDDIVYNDSEPVGYDVTLTATADDTGCTHHEYIVKKEAV